MSFLAKMTFFATGGEREIYMHLKVSQDPKYPLRYDSSIVKNKKTEILRF